MLPNLGNDLRLIFSCPRTGDPQREVTPFDNPAFQHDEGKRGSSGKVVTTQTTVVERTVRNDYLGSWAEEALEKHPAFKDNALPFTGDTIIAITVAMDKAFDQIRLATFRPDKESLIRMWLALGIALSYYRKVYFKLTKAEHAIAASAIKEMSTKADELLKTETDVAITRSVRNAVRYLEDNCHSPFIVWATCVNNVEPYTREYAGIASVTVNANDCFVQFVDFQ